ncbi:MAG TPA: alpha/beta fold hydrolase [Fimbriiglobus sp.]
MPTWTWWTVWSVAIAIPVFCALVYLAFTFFRRQYLPNVVRIFEERPLFIIPRGNPDPSAEDVTFPSTDGLNLCGCFLPARGEPRRGAILFGLEFGSTRWSAGPYCERLRDAGYDVFAYEPRNQGDSDGQSDYDPLQWVTDRDAADAQAALEYLLSRPDSDGRVGVFGISKGGSAGLLAAASHPAVACAVTDGAFATYTTMVPYMRRWISIYRPGTPSRNWVPDWFYGLVAMAAVREVAIKRRVRFPHVESVVKRFGRPLLMIHGGADTYIKPTMAHKLGSYAKTGTAEVWVVEKAKHNQALHVAGEEYHRKLVEFFDEHLGGIAPPDSNPDLGPVPYPPLPEHAAVGK